LITVAPLLFHNQPVTQLLTIMHLGKNLCGHDGVIHGGLAASILDEAFAGVVSRYVVAHL
jgi:acyl-coenzyme A thioesterase PaaI-like protein